MSKRAGNFVTLADIVDEVGKDAVRFTMLTRKADAQMDFDFARWSKHRAITRFFMSNMPRPDASLRRKLADAGVAPATRTRHASTTMSWPRQAARAIPR